MKAEYVILAGQKISVSCNQVIDSPNQDDVVAKVYMSLQAACGIEKLITSSPLRAQS